MKIKTSRSYIKCLICIVLYALIITILGELLFSKLSLIISSSITSVNIDTLNEFKEYKYADLPDNIKLFYSTASSFNNLFIYILLIAIILPLSIEFIKKDNLNFKNDTSIHAKYILIGIGLAYIGNLIGNLIILLVSEKSGSTLISENQELIEQILKSSPTNMLMMIVCASILGPIVEELIFRKAIFKVIPNEIIAWIISSLLFGLLHTFSKSSSALELFTVAIPYVLMGITFGYIYIKSNKNIMTTILLHIIYNSIGLLLTLILSQFGI